MGPINQPPPAPAPQTIKVASEGMGDCKSINGALLRSRPGDTILIKAGNYGGITIQRNNLTLAAFDPQNQPVLTGITITKANNVIIKGFMIAYDKAAADEGNNSGRQ